MMAQLECAQADLLILGLVWESQLERQSLSALQRDRIGYLSPTNHGTCLRRQCEAVKPALVYCSAVPLAESLEVILRKFNVLKQ